MRVKSTRAYSHLINAQKGSKGAFKGVTFPCCDAASPRKGLSRKKDGIQGDTDIMEKTDWMSSDSQSTLLIRSKIMFKKAKRS